MAIALVQTAALASNANLAAAGTLQTLAFGAQPIVGNLIVGWAFGYSSTHDGTKVPALTDTGGNSYTIPPAAFQFITNDLWVLVAWAQVGTSGVSFKVTLTMPTAPWGTGSVNVVAQEFSGIPTSSPQDGSAVGTTGTTGIPVPANLTLTSGSLVVAGMVRNTSSFLGSTPTGFTRVGFQNDGSGNEVGEAIYAINPTSPTAPAWTTSTTSWGVTQFALLADTGGGGGTPAEGGVSIGTGMQRQVATGWV